MVAKRGKFRPLKGLALDTRYREIHETFGVDGVAGSLSRFWDCNGCARNRRPAQPAASCPGVNSPSSTPPIHSTEKVRNAMYTTEDTHHFPAYGVAPDYWAQRALGSNHGPPLALAPNFATERLLASESLLREREQATAHAERRNASREKQLSDHTVKLVR